MIPLMALSPQQRKEAHERGLRAKAEREAGEDLNRPRIVVYGVNYERFRVLGFSHEEALAKAEERKLRNQKWRNEQPSYNRREIHVGPRGGRYRINSNGRKSYDVP